MATFLLSLDGSAMPMKMTIKYYSQGLKSGRNSHLTNNGDTPQLLRNDGGNRNHWLEVRLVGTRSNRDGIGSKVKIFADGVAQTDEAKGGMSYQAAHDPRLHFGLGQTARISMLDINWPSGAITKLTNLAADRCITVKEDFGEVPSHCPPFRRRFSP